MEAAEQIPKETKVSRKYLVPALSHHTTPTSMAAVTNTDDLCDDTIIINQAEGKTSDIRKVYDPCYSIMEGIITKCDRYWMQCNSFIEALIELEVQKITKENEHEGGDAEINGKHCT